MARDSDDEHDDNLQQQQDIHHHVDPGEAQRIGQGRHWLLQVPSPQQSWGMAAVMGGVLWLWKKQQQPLDFSPKIVFGLCCCCLFFAFMCYMFYLFVYLPELDLAQRREREREQAQRAEREIQQWLDRQAALADRVERVNRERLELLARLGLDDGDNQLPQQGEVDPVGLGVDDVNQQPQQDEADAVGIAGWKKRVEQLESELAKLQSLVNTLTTKSSDLKKKVQDLEGRHDDASENHENDRETQVMEAPALTLLQQMEKECPVEVLRKMIAFGGPRTARALSKTNTYWHGFVRQEGTWRVMCEAMFKWKAGDPVPMSWHDLYCSSPLVPDDFSTVHAALAVATEAIVLDDDKESECSLQCRSLRVLLRPVKHNLEHTLVIEAIPGIKITIETLELPNRGYNGEDRMAGESRIIPATERTSPFSWARSSSQPPRHATLVLDHRPGSTILVRRGELVVKGVQILHDSSSSLQTCFGRREAAVIVEGSLRPSIDPPAHILTTRVCFDRCAISSRSGDGVICGGANMSVSIRGCVIDDCARTGVSVCLLNSSLKMERTDVLRNGCSRIEPDAAGFSGINLGYHDEDSIIGILNCNISGNSGPGISFARNTTDLASKLQYSDFFGNGSGSGFEEPQDVAAFEQGNNRSDQEGESPLRSPVLLGRCCYVAQGSFNESHILVRNGYDPTQP